MRTDAIFLVSAVGNGYVAVAVAPFELSAVDERTASAASLDALMPKLLTLIHAHSQLKTISLRFKLADRTPS